MQWPVEEVEALRGERPVSLKDRLVKRGEHVEVTGLQTAQVSAPTVYFLFQLVHVQSGWHFLLRPKSKSTPTVLFPFSVSSCAIRVAFSSKTKKQKHNYPAELPNFRTTYFPL
jgi:hypothetical protein